MPRNELDKVAARIAEIQSTMRVTQSDDVRQMLREALAACERRRAELEQEADGLGAEAAHVPATKSRTVAVAADRG
jgi:predicted  nucleic acid-binding Zn-ribbon protein